MFRQNIPNLLTILRIVLTPVFVYFFIQKSLTEVIIGSLIFVICCLLDYLDGSLARKWKVESNFGKIWDPLADKILILTAIYLLWYKGYILLLIFLIILFREILITLLREHYRRKKIVISANIFGKIKTIMQMIGIIIILVLHVLILCNVLDKQNIILGANIYFYVVTVATVLSSWNYLKRYLKDFF